MASNGIPGKSALLSTFISVICFFFLTTSFADGRDLHALWEDRCGDCHDHAGDFARDHLAIEDGMLVGQHHRDDLRDFMQNHYMVKTEIDAVLDMLRAQVSTPPRFKHECSSCHGLAAYFVRDNLELREGVLYSRENGVPVAQFLSGHRKLSGKDADFFLQQLERIASEVFRP